MKNAGSIISFLIMANLLFISSKLQAQDWKWAFGGSGINQYTRLLGTDKFDNSYFAILYDDSLTIGGQSYYHQQYYAYNCLVVKLDKQGNLLNQIDFYSPTTAYSSMSGMKLVTDSIGNIYIGGEFAVRVFIGDTVINHLPLPYYESPSTYLVKFDSDFDMKWAKVMGCEHYVFFRNMVMRNGHITYSVNPQSWASPNPTILYCFGEDTLYFPKDKENFVYFNLDLDGNILSHYTIHSDEVYVNDEIITENNHRYLVGATYDTLFADNEPVFIPQTSNYNYFFLHYDTHDSLIESSTVNITNNTAALFITGINTENELFFRITASDGLTIGNTTIPPIYSGSCIIGKLDAGRNIVWYESISGLSNLWDLSMKPLHDTLFASFDYLNNLKLRDTTFYNSSVIPKNIILSFGPDGTLINYLKSNATGYIHTTGIDFDNCGNLMFSGNHQGKVFFNNDTLVSNSTSGRQGIFIAYLSNTIKDIDLGPDTTVCESYLIYGPSGFDHYSWNSGIGNQKDQLVTETGKYKLLAWTDKCCFMEDSVNVTILPLPLSDLGNDTTLKLSHFLQLSVPAGYEKYFWSTNAETNSIVLEGSQFAVGFHTIWCTVTNNSCTSSDTLTVEVINDYGIKETPEIDIRIKPNPFTDKFIISCEKPIINVHILDYSGKLISIFESEQDIVQPLLITLPTSANRVLMLKIKTNDGFYYRKLIQIQAGN
jgi:hypothetical protein